MKNKIEYDYEKQLTMCDEIVLHIRMSRDRGNVLFNKSNDYLNGKINSGSFVWVVKELLNETMEDIEDNEIGSSKPYMFDVDSVDLRELATKGANM